MRKTITFMLIVVLITAAVYLLEPPAVETTLIYYRTSTVSAHTTNPLPAPSSIFCQEGDQRLSLEYIAKHKHYTINSPFTETKNHTTVALLLEHLASAPVAGPNQVNAAIVDDLGQRYQLTGPAEIDLVAEIRPTNRIWRYILPFPPLNPQARNVVIYVEIGTTLFELNGAAIP